MSTDIPHSARVEIPLSVPFILTSEIDVKALENGADALVRSGQVETALVLYALALRVRSVLGELNQRRHDDPPLRNR